VSEATEDVREERLSLRVRLKSGVLAEPGQEVADAEDVEWVCPGRLRCVYQSISGSQTKCVKGTNVQQHVVALHLAKNP
jgi:hypothetical protein